MKRYHESNPGICFTKGDMHHLQMEQSIESLFWVKFLLLWLKLSSSLEKSAIQKGPMLCSNAQNTCIHYRKKPEKFGTKEGA